MLDEPESLPSNVAVGVFHEFGELLGIVDGGEDVEMTGKTAKGVNADRGPLLRLCQNADDGTGEVSGRL